MTENFIGFTDRDLNQLNISQPTALGRNGISTRTKPRRKLDTQVDIPQQAKLFNPDVGIEDADTTSNEINIHLIEQPTKVQEPSIDNVKSESIIEKAPDTEIRLLKSDCIDNPPTVKHPEPTNPLPLIDLNEFEKKRKQLEDENEHAKLELEKVLHDRVEKAKKEAQKLHQIEVELSQIDAVLSNDIGIIRNQIEQSSLHFMEAQKKFDYAEKEYNTALAELMKCKQKKMLLTYHLCSIIEQNELKKAQKLSDLMQKLELKQLPPGAFNLKEMAEQSVAENHSDADNATPS